LPIRILIADDNASVRAAMRQVLETAGEHWEVLEADNGEEAVAKTKEVIPNLIIMDLVMPVMDGLTAAKQIGQLLPGVPILMHTLYPFPQVEFGEVLRRYPAAQHVVWVQEEPRNMGAWRFVYKVFEPLLEPTGRKIQYAGRVESARLNTGPTPSALRI